MMPDRNNCSIEQEDHRSPDADAFAVSDSRYGARRRHYQQTESTIGADEAFAFRHGGSGLSDDEFRRSLAGKSERAETGFSEVTIDPAAEAIAPTSWEQRELRARLKREREGWNR